VGCVVNSGASGSNGVEGDESSARSAQIVEQVYMCWKLPSSRLIDARELVSIGFIGDGRKPAGEIIRKVIQPGELLTTSRRVYIGASVRYDFARWEFHRAYAILAPMSICR